jgi:hypothetical protein
MSATSEICIIPYTLEHPLLKARKERHTYEKLHTSEKYP